MDEDIVPALLETINKQFDSRVRKDAVIQKALLAAKRGSATYADANKFAIEVGEILSSVLGNNISSAALPDGRMYYNIGQRILSETLKKNHDLISGYSEDVQKNLNKMAGIGLKVQVPELNKDKISGMVNRLDSEANFDNAAWMLKEPIVNFSQCIVDDAVKKNVEFQAKTGLHPTVTRRLMGRGCSWCRNLAGVYEYPDVPKNVYQRHENDHCIVEYDPGSGKRQNVWTKQWQGSRKDVTINRDEHSSNSTYKLNGPMINMRRPKREDFDNYEDFVVERNKYRNYKKNREAWLDNEAERFYNLRKKDISTPSQVIKKITGYGFATENLTALDPVQLDAVGKTLDDINKRLPDFMQYLRKQNFDIRAVPVGVGNRAEDMSWNLGVRINSDHFSDAAKMKQSIRAMIDDRTELPGENWHPHSNEFTHNITHEFGHAFEDYAADKLGRGKIWLNIADEFQVQQVRDLPFVSEYGREDQSEWFAELFAQTLVGEPDENTRRMLKIINQTMKESKP